MSRKNITRFVPDHKNPPKLSKADLKRLDAMGDNDIDYSDIPEFSEEFWKTARLLKPGKKHMISLRVDDEVLKWFRTQGRGYQAYMNTVLRSFVEASKQIKQA